MIWNPEYEAINREKLRELQLKRLQALVKWVYNEVPFYKGKFDDAGVKPSDIRDLEDIKRLPFTVKNDLRDTYPFGMFAVPMEKVVRVHSSSGTTGKPIVVGYTRADIHTWSELTARVAVAGGADAKDIAQMAFGYGLFTGGFGMHAGLERIGASVVPVSTGNTERQIMLMKDFGATILISTPSYALHIAEVGESMGVDFAAMPIRLGLFGAERCSDKMREQIEDKMRISATDNYGLTEVIGPGVAGECEAKNGLHLNEDHFLVEVIDPETGGHVAPGEIGEIVFTTLTKEAFPVIRYRTRDLTRVTEEPCACGRTLARMEKVRGRTDDMLIIRGVNVFPSQFESVLFEIEGIEPHYQIIVDRRGAMDDVELLVEVSNQLFLGEMKELLAFEREIEHKLNIVLGIKVDVKLVEPKTLERTSGKAQRVIDKRDL
ncbi:MAG: phenylacetate--CoA ligase [Candidatus Aquicultor primus]|uniref:Phenylacetate-coenzyme A ligase n=1 Tax=Candidatus Aquicultor primus TaxID=1797195 RepID=A0A1F2UPS7_9ACTN|nr:MAG: phenylacetate--CoA ligase [Candidatus Aquicultor primus]